jgi:hypothetical protein
VYIVVFIPGVKQPGRVDDNSSLSSAEVKECVGYTFAPQYAFMAWCLLKHREYFTFTSMGWTIGILGSDSQRGLGIFPFTTGSRTALGPIQPPIQWVPGILSLGVERQEPEADHSPPSSAEAKNVWGYTSTPPICLHGVVLS